MFVPHGSEISFVLAYIQITSALIAEFVNMWVLITQDRIDNCVIYFVSLKVIMEVANIYFESLLGNKLRVVMEESPKLLQRETKIKFSDRTLFHKVARLIYKGFRALYVAALFYFAPFIVVYL